MCVVGVGVVVGVGEVGCVVFSVCDGEEDDGTPLRYRYAGIGMIYDPAADIFHYVQPYPSWTYNNTTYTWHPPTPYPKDTGDDDDTTYYWDEENKQWADNDTAPDGEDRRLNEIPGWNYE